MRQSFCVLLDPVPLSLRSPLMFRKMLMDRQSRASGSRLTPTNENVVPNVTLVNFDCRSERSGRTGSPPVCASVIVSSRARSEEESPAALTGTLDRHERTVTREVSFHSGRRPIERASCASKGTRSGLVYALIGVDVSVP